MKYKYKIMKIGVSWVGQSTSSGQDKQDFWKSCQEQEV